MWGAWPPNRPRAALGLFLNDRGTYEMCGVIDPEVDAAAAAETQTPGEIIPTGEGQSRSESVLPLIVHTTLALPWPPVEASAPTVELGYQLALCPHGSSRSNGSTVAGKLNGRSKRPSI